MSKIRLEETMDSDTAEYTVHRTVEQLEKDFVLPSGAPVGASIHDLTIRLRAVREVLLRLPEEPYQKLAEGIDGFQWFIPYETVRGLVAPFYVNQSEKTEYGGMELKPYSRVVYLSPMLERRSYDTAVATIAHELAHIIFDHPLHGVSPESEEEARQAVYDWGFGREAKKLAAADKAWEARHVNLH